MDVPASWRKVTLALGMMAPLGSVTDPATSERPPAELRPCSTSFEGTPIPAPEPTQPPCPAVDAGDGGLGADAASRGDARRTRGGRLGASDCGRCQVVTTGEGAGTIDDSSSYDSTGAGLKD